MIIGVFGSRNSVSEKAAKYYCRKNKIFFEEIKHWNTIKGVVDALNCGDIAMGFFPEKNAVKMRHDYGNVYSINGEPFKLKEIFSSRDCRFLAAT